MAGSEPQDLQGKSLESLGLLPTAMDMWNPPSASIIFPLSRGGERLRGDGRGG